MAGFTSGSIASVDATLYNERLDAGDSLEQVQEYLKNMRLGMIDVASFDPAPQKSKQEKERPLSKKERRRLKNAQRQAKNKKEIDEKPESEDNQDEEAAEEEDDVPFDVALQTIEESAAQALSAPASPSENDTTLNGEQHSEHTDHLTVSIRPTPDENEVIPPVTPWTIFCGACEQVWYCSEECARADRPLHELQCAALRKLRGVSWAAFDRTMARTILHLLAHRHFDPQPASAANTAAPSSSASTSDKDPQPSSESSSPRRLERHCGCTEYASESARKQLETFTFDFDVMSLVSNEHDIMSKTMVQRKALVRFIKSVGNRNPVLQLPDMASIVRLIGKVDQNTFGVRYDRNLSYAFGVFPSMSYFNHSCAPNIAVIQTNTALKMLALRDIDAGEEVAISYIETDRPKLARRKCLQAEYNFTCCCPRCNIPPSNTLRDDFVHRYVCPNPMCDGKGLLIPILDSSSGQVISSACNICQSDELKRS